MVSAENTGAEADAKTLERRTAKQTKIKYRVLAKREGREWEDWLLDMDEDKARREVGHGLRVLPTVQFALARDTVVTASEIIETFRVPSPDSDGGNPSKTGKQPSASSPAETQPQKLAES